jgi:prepilin peptidase CpaA
MFVSAYLLFIFLGIAAIFDLFCRRVPNYWTGIGAGIGMATPWLGGHGISLAGAYLGGVLAFSLFFLPYASGWMGAGDVKLFGASGLFLGWEGVIAAALHIALAGGILAILYLLTQFFYFFRNKKNQSKYLAARGLPYAVAIFFGTAWSLLFKGIIQ